MSVGEPLWRPRKRRRRRQIAVPLSAHLVLDDQLSGDVGLLSEDLFIELFRADRFINGTETNSSECIRHIAIAPWAPVSPDLVDSSCWTVLPVKKLGRNVTTSKETLHSTLRFPASSLALQRFANALRIVAPAKLASRTTASIEIRVLDVVPLALDSIYVTVDGEALKKMDEAYGKFGGGFSGWPMRNGKGSSNEKGEQLNGLGQEATKDAIFSSDNSLKQAIRKALMAPNVVRAGDMLPLPLPSHPITHAPPPPAKITLCEPVSQGQLLSSTKVVVIRSRPRDSTTRITPQIPAQQHLEAPADEDDTSNEQFYSAAEEKESTVADSVGEDGEDASETDASAPGLSESESADFSDDDMDEMISLSAPTLPPHSSGVLSSFTLATPRPGGAYHGISTPGSVVSSYTITAQGFRRLPKDFFKVQGLLGKIPDDLLHPRPLTDDDDEARIFLETNMLAKVGCFSGDWVRIRPVAESHNTIDSWAISGLGQDGDGPQEARVARIYGLPESYPKKSHRYPLNKSGERRLSFSSHLPLDTTARAYLSPVILANLGGPSHLRISPLSTLRHTAGSPSPSLRKLVASALPPPAKEVTLLKISTPLSTDRSLQPSLLSGLKRYFEQKRRLVKQGDLVAVSIDETLGRAAFSGSSSGENDAGLDDFMGSTVAGTGNSVESSNARNRKVAWFKVGHVLNSKSETFSGPDGADIWNGMAVIDTLSTRMVQAGSEQGVVPSAATNPWEYYLGIRRLSGRTGILYGDPIFEMPTPHLSATRRRLRELIAATTSARAMHLGLPPVAILLVSNQRSIGKATTAIKACADLGVHSFVIDAYDIITEGGASGGDVKTEAFLKARSERALACGPECTAVIVKRIEALTAERISSAMKEIIADSRILIATTTDVEKVPEGVRSLFTHELEISAPDEGEREALLRDVIEDKGVKVASDVDISAVAIKTAALVAGDLVDVVERAIVAKQERIEKLARSQGEDVDITPRDVQISGGEAGRCIIKADFDLAIDAARKNFADAIGAPKIPNVTWDDVGGLTNVKDAVMETIQLPLERPELFAKGMKKRSGILFYGPPGTGKTLLAKAIATEFSLNFFSVKGPELLNMYIGESEANVRRVFQKARDARPCVVFFDELDSVAPKRGNQGDSGGVMDRIVSQLLAELDGMSNGEENGGGVFVIGATNRPDLLDQALLRPGRFDKMLYLGVSDTHDKQLTILEALTRKFNLHPSLSLRRVARSLPFTYTGADLYALCSDAMLKAITRQASAVDQKIKALPGGTVTTAYFFDHFATEEDISVMVTEEDFSAAHRELVPSVSAKELEHYDRVRRTFESNDDKDPREALNALEALENQDYQDAIMSIAPSGASGPGILPPQGLRATGVEQVLPLHSRPKQRGNDHFTKSTAKSKSKSVAKGKGKSASANATTSATTPWDAVDGDGDGAEEDDESDSDDRGFATGAEFRQDDETDDYYDSIPATDTTVSNKINGAGSGSGFSAGAEKKKAKDEEDEDEYIIRGTPNPLISPTSTVPNQTISAAISAAAMDGWAATGDRDRARASDSLTKDQSIKGHGKGKARAKGNGKGKEEENVE